MDFAGILDDPYFDLSDLPEDPTLRIPPLQEPAFFSHRRPSPLEPNAGENREAQNTKAKLSGQKGVSQPSDHVEASSGHHVVDGIASSITRPAAQQLPKTALPLTINLRLIEKGGNDLVDSDGPRKKIWLEDSEKTSEFVKLPKPRARPQKNQSQMPTFGPITIVNGLVEPPPNAALLPPIEPEELKWTGTVKDASVEVTNVVESATAQDVTEELEKRQNQLAAPLSVVIKHSTPKSEQKDTRVRRKFIKWTTEETDTLLQGVAKFGIGKWKEIVEHPDYTFNNRNATDLKDRFRVVCPEAWSHRAGKESKPKRTKNSHQNGEPESSHPILSSHKSTGILASNILLPQSPPTCPNWSKSSIKSSKAKSRAHAYPPSALEKLGIASFTPSPRRARRPFTPEEDANLNAGIRKYGFQWAMIQKDKEFQLGHRKSTDLRDRIRNLDPQRYQNAKIPLSRSSVNALGKKEDGSEKEDDADPNRTDIKSQESRQHAKEDRTPATEETTRTESKTKRKTPAGRQAQNKVGNSSVATTDTSLPPLSLGQGGPGVNMALLGYELPAISSAVGDNPFDESGGDAFDWGDNTLPKLLNWDDL